MDQIGSALAERGTKVPPEAAGFPPTVPLERYGDTLLIQINERLFDLVPSERRKRGNTDDLPWYPKSFDLVIPEKNIWNRRALDSLVDIIRGGADVVDLTEPNSTIAQTLEDFLVFDADVAKVRRAKIDFDDDIRTINRALDSAHERDVDAPGAHARRLRSEIDYTFAVNLNQMARDRLRAAKYQIDKDVELNVTLVSSVIIAALARQNARLAALRTPMRWVPLVAAGDGRVVLPFNLVPLPPHDSTYDATLATLDMIAGDVVIDSIEHRDTTLLPPPPHTLPSLYLELEKTDPAAWTPSKLREALVSLSKKGCITNPWRTAPRYPAWSPRRIDNVLNRLREMRAEISTLANLVAPGAHLDGDNPRITALTPLGRPYDEAEPLPHAALREIVSRWVAHLLGPATVRVTRYIGHIGTQQVAVETQHTTRAGWTATVEREPAPNPYAHITIGARLTIVESRVHPYEGPIPEQYRIGTLLEDLLDPIRLIFEPTLREEIPQGATLASPEHIMSVVEKQVYNGVIKRNKHTGWIDLSEHGAALYDVFPAHLRHPAFVVGFRNAFRRTGGDQARLDALRKYAYDQLTIMLDDMRKRVPKRSGSWKTASATAKTHNRQEER